MKLFNRLFPKAAELERASKRIDGLVSDVGELTIKNANLWESFNRVQASVETLTKENADLKAKVRKQTEADLLLVSMQIQKRIIDGEKIETSSSLQALYAQQQNLAANSPYAGYMGQLGYSASNLGMIGSLLSGRSQ